MPAVLLDTDVFSFVFKRDSRAARFEPHLTGSQACLSFQSVAELRRWPTFPPSTLACLEVTPEAYDANHSNRRATLYHLAK